MTLGKLYRTLEKLKKEFEYCPYEGRGRNTHCWIIINHNGKDHNFDVRGWTFNPKRYTLRISAVNWTLCAGTCVLELNAVNTKALKFKVKDI